MADTPNGMALAEALYFEAARPLIEKHFPRLRYAAALIGPGSEVLGYDDEMSQDHHWGPRFQIFLDDDDLASEKPALKEMLAHELPLTILGVPTNFTEPGIDGSQLLEEISKGPVRHRIQITTAHLFMERLLGFDPRDEPGPADWLSFSSQTLLCLTSGRVFVDDVGLGALRQKLHYFPHDVWLYMMAASWKRISQEEHLVGRTGFVGDDLGSRVLAARLVSDIIHLTFLQERRYAPYAKWLQRSFVELGNATLLQPHLDNALSADSWQSRISELAGAYEILATAHNNLDVTPTISATRTNFWDRPFPVIHAERFTDALVSEIQDPEVKAIAMKGHIGGIDQISDQTDFKHPHWRRQIASLYRSQSHD